MREDRMEGALVVGKTCRIVREIARTGAVGARLVDITRNTGLTRPSIHRILTQLRNERFVSQSPTRRYRLTSQVHEIGLSAPSPVAHPNVLRPVIRRLSDACGDTVYVAMRNGDNADFLLREDGAVATGTPMVQARETLPLVSCYSGRALLAAMPGHEADDIIDACWAQAPGLFKAATRTSVIDDVQFVREHGYGWAHDMTSDGLAGLTRPVPNPNGPSYLAVTIAAVSPRLTIERARALLPALTEATQAIRDLIDRPPG